MSSDERKNEAAKVWCASLGEPSPEEQHDDALTSEYKGRSVRVDKVNGTVQNVKFGFAHVVLGTSNWGRRSTAIEGSPPTKRIFV